MSKFIEVVLYREEHIMVNVDHITSYQFSGGYGWTVCLCNGSELHLSDTNPNIEFWKTVEGGAE